MAQTAAIYSRVSSDLQLAAPGADHGGSLQGPARGLRSLRGCPRLEGRRGLRRARDLRPCRQASAGAGGLASDPGDLRAAGRHRRDRDQPNQPLGGRPPSADSEARRRRLRPGDRSPANRHWLELRPPAGADSRRRGRVRVRDLGRAPGRRQGLPGPAPAALCKPLMAIASSQRPALVIHDAEAAIVARIFREALEGRAQAKIAARLTADGVNRAPGAPGIKRRSRRSCAGRMYLGDVAYKGETFPGNHEPIIDRETFDAVARGRRASPNGHGRGGPGRDPAGRHIFTRGRLRCAVCGGGDAPPNRSGPRDLPVLDSSARPGGLPGYAPAARANRQPPRLSLFERTALDVAGSRRGLEAAARAREVEIARLITEAEGRRKWRGRQPLARARRLRRRLDHGRRMARDQGRPRRSA